jgi:hypothetical protein
MRKALAKQQSDGVDVQVLDGGRHLVLKHNGKITSTITQATVWRGNWRAGPYQHGDNVYHARCTWAAMRDTSDEPGKSDAWMLCLEGADAYADPNSQPPAA